MNVFEKVSMAKATWIELDKMNLQNIDIENRLSPFDLDSEYLKSVEKEIIFINKIRETSNLVFYNDNYEVMFYFFEDACIPINKCEADLKNIDLARRYYAKEFNFQKDVLENIGFKVIGYRATSKKENMEAEIMLSGSIFHPLFYF
ncbi:MAG: hypothetical protein OXK80_00695 [Bdellovibrionales bacterium]|nr:hypothetical protein [Bdellovibrionales bacterium]